MEGVALGGAGGGGGSWGWTVGGRPGAGRRGETGTRATTKGWLVSFIPVGVEGIVREFFEDR